MPAGSFWTRGMRLMGARGIVGPVGARRVIILRSREGGWSMRW